MPSKAIHHSLKIGNRRANYDFFTKTLQMKVLRHEEIDSGCKIECNGPYDNPWSKTIVGYGSEADQFVLELTYNYDVDSYTVRDELEGIYIQSDELMKSLEGKAGATKLPNGGIQIRSPDGYPFYICPGQGPKIKDSVSLHYVFKIGDRKASYDFFTKVLQMKVRYHAESCRCGSIGKDAKFSRRIEFFLKAWLWGGGYGRIAFSYPDDKLSELQSKIKAANLPILKELVTLETPGKASVQVVILLDPDNHEICFVGDKGFRELSKVDPKADEHIRKEIEQDNSASCLFT
ncbi:unnamed protein product [Cylicocyclus nassatus]|uniref:VOC domain-containing protein n=1 Tax=Cylicocyclus nassatus TaxID=53992 RepID=A0AA36GWZ5_CYLNA|nr:unnamed protein product [Cylicocyclus nassatus]